MRLKTKPTTTTEIGIDDLADLPRWVAWRVEEREGKDGSPYKTKIPHDPNRQGLARIPTHAGEGRSVLAAIAARNA
jgi:hypothetical protein